jgi:hypothetical protein
MSSEEEQIKLTRFISGLCGLKAKEDKIVGQHATLSKPEPRSCISKALGDLGQNSLKIIWETGTRQVPLPVEKEKEEEKSPSKIPDYFNGERTQSFLRDFCGKICVKTGEGKCKELALNYLAEKIEFDEMVDELVKITGKKPEEIGLAWDEVSAERWAAKVAEKLGIQPMDVAKVWEALPEDADEEQLASKLAEKTGKKIGEVKEVLESSQCFTC